jgi:hypothetical protein
MEAIDKVSFKLILLNSTDDILHYKSFEPEIKIKSFNKRIIHPGEKFMLELEIPFGEESESILMFDELSITLSQYLQPYQYLDKFDILYNTKYQTRINHSKKYQPYPKLLNYSEVTMDLIYK